MFRANPGGKNDGITGVAFGEWMTIKNINKQDDHGSLEFPILLVLKYKARSPAKDAAPGLPYRRTLFE